MADSARGFLKRLASKEVRMSLKFRVLGTSAKERFWARRHLLAGSDWGKNVHSGKKNGWVEDYWDSRVHPHRQLLLERIATQHPGIKSLLEVGSNCGPNLYLLARAFPNAKIVGIDINERAVQRGNELFSEQGIRNVELRLGKADRLECFEDKSFDLVFTDALLIYIGPDKIRRVMDGMFRVAKEALMLLEWHAFEGSGERATELGTYRVEGWVRDYAALLKHWVAPGRIEIVKMPDGVWQDRNWERFGALIEVTVR